MSVRNLSIFTICSNNYIPFARVFFDSVKKYHPEARLYLCLADERLVSADFYPRGCEVVTVQELRIPEFRSFAFRYEIAEFKMALKPYMLRYLLALGHDDVLYFDPDVEVFAPLDGILTPLREGASFVVTPRICRPPQSDTCADDTDILHAGVYNPAFLGVGRGPQTEAVLRWWSRGLQRRCASDEGPDIFENQRFMDLVPGFADDVRILRDTAYNVAYWNLAQRELTQDAGCWLVDGQPLRFFHFSGIDPDDVTRLSKYTAAFQGNEIMPPLLALMHRYIDQVVVNGFAAGTSATYAYDLFASGVPIPVLARQMFRDSHFYWSGNPFETYEDYLCLPTAQQWGRSAGYMITNLMAGLHRSQPQLAATYDLTCREGVEAYTHWFISNASAFLQGGSRFIDSVANRISRFNRSGSIRRLVPAKRAPYEVDVSVVGYLRLALGIGEAGRQVLRTLVHAGLKARGLPVQLDSNSPRVDDSLEHLMEEEASGRFQLLNVNAGQVPQVIGHLGEKLRGDAYRIIMPFWELANLPDPWLGSFDLIDEVWAPTRFIQSILDSKVRKPVLHMPLLLDFEIPQPAPRTKFGLPADSFLFFFAFDYFSFVDRKNPVAVVRAFKEAFRSRTVNSKVGLVFKTMNGASVPETSAALRDQLRDDPDVMIIEDTLTRAGTLQLMGACDAVVSLHRSEGLGLLVAEAMALGKPVISTNYAATTELVTSETGYPVDYELVPVKKGQYPFHEGQVWAEPDVGHAARLMRQVFEDRTGRMQRADAARLHLAKEYDLEACARRVRDRLHALDQA
jgi:glycosyltransferase involved in cell wall biosynthesis